MGFRSTHLAMIVLEPALSAPLPSLLLLSASDSQAKFLCHLF